MQSFLLARPGIVALRLFVRSWPATISTRPSPAVSSRSAFWAFAAGPASSSPRSTPGSTLPVERLIVETDGHRTHGTRSAFERDRRRDQRLALAGWRVVRFTWGQIANGPD